MQKLFILLFFFSLISFAAYTQQLPMGACGIVHTYDASGNRLKRVYFCNNGIDPYPTKTKAASPAVSEEYQQVDALYPNPTTGRFFVTFSKALKNARVLLTDVNGKAISEFRASGYKVDFDLSGVAAGVYYVRIYDEGKVLTKKVVKQ